MVRFSTPCYPYTIKYREMRICVRRRLLSNSPRIWSGCSRSEHFMPLLLCAPSLRHYSLCQTYAAGNCGSRPSSPPWTQPPPSLQRHGPRLCAKNWPDILWTATISDRSSAMGACVACGRETDNMYRLQVGRHIVGADKSSQARRSSAVAQ